MQNRLRALIDGPDHPVASLSVQAQAAKTSSKRRSQFQVLTSHLFHALFVNNSSVVEAQTATQIVQSVGSLSLPPILLTLILIGSYNGLIPFMHYRSFWLRVQDHFIFCSYSFSVVGMVALLRWESFFPSLLDARILGVLPIPRLQLFMAKASAVGLFLGLFVAGVNLPSTILLPSIAGAPNALLHALAHFLAVTVAGCFGAIFPLTLLAICESIPIASLQRWIAPFLQGLLVALFWITGLFAPFLASSTQGLLQQHSALLSWLPPYWFLGIYEWVLGGSSSDRNFAPLAKMGVMATAISLASLFAFYPLAYQQKFCRLIEGVSIARGRNTWLANSLSRVVGRLLPSPHHRAAFFFVGETMLRIARFRIILIIAGCSGAAVALMEVVRFQGALSYPVLAMRELRPVDAVGVVIFALIGGSFWCLSSIEQPAAGWIFVSVAGQAGRSLASGTRRWVAIVACTACLLLLCGVTLVLPRPAFHAGLFLRQLATLWGWCIIVVMVVFTHFRDFPFTTMRLRQRANMVLCAVHLLVVFPVSLFILRFLGNLSSHGWWPVAAWVSFAGGMYAGVCHWYEEVDLRPLFADENETVQLLNLQN